MHRPRHGIWAVTGGVAVALVLSLPVRGAEPKPPAADLVPETGIVTGTVKSIDPDSKRIIVVDEKTGEEVAFALTAETSVQSGAIQKIDLTRITQGSKVSVRD